MFIGSCLTDEPYIMLLILYELFSSTTQCCCAGSQPCAILSECSADFHSKALKQHISLMTSPSLAEALLTIHISCCRIWLEHKYADWQPNATHDCPALVLVSSQHSTSSLVLQVQEAKMPFRETLDGSTSLLAHFSPHPERLQSPSQPKTVR